MPDLAATGRRVARGQRQAMPVVEDVIRHGRVTAATYTGGVAILTVDIEGGGEVPGIRALGSYASPALNDHVLVVGSEGAWTCLGTVSAPSWVPWTPVVDNGLTVGNGTWFAEYVVDGKICHFYLQFNLGSTSAITGDVQIRWPVTPGVTSRQANSFRGFVEDSSGTDYLAAGYRLNSTAFRIIAPARSAANERIGAALINATTPFTWTTGDIITLSGTYRTA